MADPFGNHDSDPKKDDALAPDSGTSAGMPRWVKVLLIVGIVLVLLFLIAMALGLGGGHGPGRHGASGAMPAPNVPENSGQKAPLHHRS